MAKSKHGKRKMKKGTKALIIIVLLAILGVGGYFGYKHFFNQKPVEVKVVGNIDKYGYTLKDSHPAAYKKMFEELKEILLADTIDEEKYAKQISRMFIYDFYSLDYKKAKTDVGGVEFVHPAILDNFLFNAEDTYYKYVESNIYNQRHQDLPKVTDIKIDNVEKTSFKYDDKEEKTKTKYDDKEDTEAYKVKVSWNYNSGKYDSYQKEATLIFIHDGIKLVLVELQ